MSALDRASVGVVQNASERRRNRARLERLRDQLTDTGGECLLRPDRATVAAYEDDRQVGPAAAHRARESGSGEPRHEIIGDNDVESSRRDLERGKCSVAVGEWYRFVSQPRDYLGRHCEQRLV